LTRGHDESYIHNAGTDSRPLEESLARSDCDRPSFSDSGRDLALHGGFDVQGVARVLASLFGKVEGGKESGGFVAQCFAHTTCRNVHCPSSHSWTLGCAIQERAAICGTRVKVRSSPPALPGTPSNRLFPRKNADSIGFDKGPETSPLCLLGLRSGAPPRCLGWEFCYVSIVILGDRGGLRPDLSP
jgi:hypothetical protein